MDLASPQAEALATEHLVHLPKMSPTAGVATQEYVAINGAAIAALMLGMASIMTLMNPAFAVIAAAGVLTSTVSLLKIRHSNGTETGRGLAMTGLFLAVGFCSFVAASAVMQDWAQQDDRRAIAALCDQFGQAVSARHYDAAYDLFSMRFKSQVSRQDFVARLKGEQEELDREYAAKSGSGPIVACTWNGLATFQINEDNGTYTATSGIDFHLKDNANLWPLPALFRKAGNAWWIEAIPDLFETTQRA
jgi:hypothetical protein